MFGLSVRPMDDVEIGARTVEAVRSVSINDATVRARTVEAVRSVSMGDGAISVSTAVAQEYATMINRGHTVWSVKEVRSVSINVRRHTARTAILVSEKVVCEL